MTDNSEGKLKIIKGLVFFMTTLLILGLVLIVYGATYGKKDAQNTQSSQEQAVEAEKSPFEAVTIRSDKKTVIKDMIECGGMLCVSIASGNMENVVIINPKTGKLQGNVNIVLDEALQQK